MNIAQNTFEGGLMMDLHPLSSINTVMSNCLNGTFLTFNGNEYILQNDMGNGRVETACLPPGYIPVGTAAFGGIIYIVSYNPLSDKCQIGCFPSPERNFTEEDFNDNIEVEALNQSKFITNDKITSEIVKIKLQDLKLNSGDKFLITASNINNNKLRLSDYSSDKVLGNNPKYIKLRIATTDAGGKLIYLDSSIKWYKMSNSNYYILDEEELDKSETEDKFESYRNKTSSEYSIFTNKSSGELYIVAELETIDSFNYSYETNVNGDEVILKFYEMWTSKNWDSSQKGIDPKWVEYDYELEGQSEHKEISIYPDNCNIIYKNNEIEYRGNIDDRYGNNVIIHPGDYNQSIPREIIRFTKSKDKSTIREFKFTITPHMEYGKLSKYSVSGKLDLNKIGTGDIELTRWKYYVSSNLLYLSYGFNAYPETNKFFYGVRFRFYDVNNLPGDTSKLKDEDHLTYTYIDSGKNSYGGIFSAEIPISENDLNPNKLYYVKIDCIYLDSNFITNSLNKKDLWNTEYLKSITDRLLYTSDTFNELYKDSNVFDFDKEKIKLNPILKYNSSLDQLRPVQTQVLGNIEYNSTNKSSDDIMDKTLGYTEQSIDGYFNVETYIEYTNPIIQSEINSKIELYKNDGNPTYEINIVKSSNVNNPSGIKYKNQNLIDSIIKPELNIEVTSGKNKGEFKLKTNSKNKVCATSINNNTEITYLGKFYPIIYNKNDLSKYGITINGNHFKFYNGVYWSDGWGLGKCSYDSNSIIIGDFLGYSGIMKSGHDIGDPVNEWSDLQDGQYQTNLITSINKVTNSPIIPWSAASNTVNGTYLLRALYAEGTKNLLYYNETSKRGVAYSSIHKCYALHTHFNCFATNDRTISNSFNKDNNQIYRGSNYRNGFIGLIMKSTEGKYYFTGNFGGLNASKSLAEGIADGNISMADVVVNFLASTYHLVTDDSLAQEPRANQLGYVPSYTSECSIPIKIKYDIDENNTYICGTKISTLKEKIKKYRNFSSTYLNNISIDGTSLQKEEVITLFYSYEVPETLKNIYLNTKQNTYLLYNTVNKEGVEKKLRIVLDRTIPASTRLLYTLDLKNNKLYNFDSLPFTEELYYDQKCSALGISNGYFYPVCNFNNYPINNNIVILKTKDYNSRNNFLIPTEGIKQLIYNDDQVLINEGVYRQTSDKRLYAYGDACSDNSYRGRLHLTGISFDMAFSKYTKIL